MSTFRQFLEGVRAFETAQGSRYEVSGDRTRRTKSLHVMHDKNDVGVKDWSELTVYVHPELAKEVGMWGSSSAPKKRLVLADGKVYLLSVGASGGHGLDRIHTGQTGFYTQPAVGMCPLEVWGEDGFGWPWVRPGMRVYRSSHPGNKITRVE